jgi:hypothetical protein
MYLEVFLVGNSSLGDYAFRADMSRDVHHDIQDAVKQRLLSRG